MESGPASRGGLRYDKHMGAVCVYRSVGKHGQPAHLHLGLCIGVVSYGT